MATGDHPIIIFLDRGGFVIYEDVLSNVWQFPFAPELVRNLDVVNKEQLTTLIKGFIQTNKVVPGKIVVILSDSVIFQKDLTTQAQPQLDLAAKELQDKEIKNFLDNVPFEETMSRVINGLRIVAANKDLMDTILEPFKKIGCIVNAVVPAFIYEKYIDFSGGLNKNIAKTVFQQGDILKQGSLLINEAQAPKEVPADEIPAQPAKKSNNLRQYMLSGVFVLLLLLLGIVYFAQNRSNEKPLSKSSLPQPSGSLSISPTIPIAQSAISPTASLPAQPMDLKNIKITIIGNKETEVVSNAIKNLLAAQGFKTIETKDSADALPAKSSVLFSKSVSDEIRKMAVLEIKKLFPDVIVSESQEEAPTINIILGKN